MTEFSNKLSDEILANPEETLGLIEMAIEESGLVKNVRVRLIDIPKSQEMNVRNIRSKNLNEILTEKIERTVNTYDADIELRYFVDLIRAYEGNLRKVNPSDYPSQEDYLNYLKSYDLEFMFNPDFLSSNPLLEETLSSIYERAKVEGIIAFGELKIPYLESLLGTAIEAYIREIGDEDGDGVCEMGEVCFGDDGDGVCEVGESCCAGDLQGCNFDNGCGGYMQGPCDGGENNCHTECTLNGFGSPSCTTTCGN